MNNYNKYDLICFGFLPWSNMWKRNQSMMAEMAKFDFINKVIFVNPVISAKSLFKEKSKKFRTSLNIIHKFFPIKISSKILVYTPIYFLPFQHRFRIIKRINAKIILRSIRQLISKNSYILFMNNPKIFSQFLLDELLKKAELSIFDISDDFVEIHQTKKIREFYRYNAIACARSADIVLTVNEHVKNKYSYLNPNIHVLRNATNYFNFDREKFNSIPLLEKIKSIGRPLLGYTGWVNSSRIDFSILDYLLKERPTWQFIFIGPADFTFTERYKHYINIHLLPPVDYRELPDYLNYFDVAIVPFLINENTKGNDLLKFHDYLAMGKPVVSTDIGGAKDLNDVLKIAYNPHQFLQQIEKTISSDTQLDIANRKKRAFNNSWPNRIEELVRLIKEYI